jgi:hypothetical protein
LGDDCGVDEVVASTDVTTRLPVVCEVWNGCRSRLTAANVGTDRPLAADANAFEVADKEPEPFVERKAFVDGVSVVRRLGSVR